MNQQSIEKSSSLGSLPDKEDLQRLAVSESGFIFDPLNGKSFTCNGTGLEIIVQMQKVSSMNELIQQMVEKYDASQSEVERDVIDFVASVRRAFEL